MSLHLGPGDNTSFTPHCLIRDFSPLLLIQAGNISVYDRVMASEDFWSLDRNTEGVSLTDFSIHSAGHISVGGQIGEVRQTLTSICGALDVKRKDNGR